MRVKLATQHPEKPLNAYWGTNYEYKNYNALVVNVREGLEECKIDKNTR